MGNWLDDSENWRDSWERGRTIRDIVTGYLAELADTAINNAAYNDDDELAELVLLQNSDDRHRKTVDDNNERSPITDVDIIDVAQRDSADNTRSDPIDNTKGKRNDKKSSAKRKKSSLKEFVVEDGDQVINSFFQIYFQL